MQGERLPGMGLDTLRMVPRQTLMRAFEQIDTGILVEALRNASADTRNHVLDTIDPDYRHGIMTALLASGPAPRFDTAFASRELLQVVRDQATRDSAIHSHSRRHRHSLR